MQCHCEHREIGSIRRLVTNIAVTQFNKLLLPSRLPNFEFMKMNSTDSFGNIFAEFAGTFPSRSLSPGECQTPDGKRCSLCFANRLTYDDEIKAKNLALEKFWQMLDIDIQPEPLVASPLGRGYRTVSKRKAFKIKNGIRFGLIGIDDETDSSFPLPVGQCAIEPAEHSEIYRRCQEYLTREENRQFAVLFNYIIVKGDTPEFTVIFNVSDFPSYARSFLNGLSKYLSKHIDGITGVFVFVDSVRSRYYLSSKPRTKNRKPSVINKIFGKNKIFHAVENKKFLYSPLSFSQTNHSILPSFIRSAKELLALSSKESLYDLYCGYGLFGLSFSDDVKKVIGIDISTDAIQDAKENGARMKAANCRFIAEDLTVETLEKHLPSEEKHLKVILDPPRNGTPDGLIEYIAAAEPERVLHIFCNIELMPKELKRWTDCGYRIEKIVPFDMFPGTKEVEIMALLIR
jgi:23S rRNA (uracil1939-C5)-methyltransferase